MNQIASNRYTKMPSASTDKYLPVNQDNCNGSSNSLSKLDSNNVHPQNVDVQFKHVDAEMGDESEVTFFNSGESKKKKSKWTVREKYLLSFCLLLFIACVVFVIIAFTRDRSKKGYNNELGAFASSDGGTIITEIVTNGDGTTEKRICLSQHCVQTAASLLQNMDQRIDPCDNFYNYACGGWDKRFVIPETKSNFDTFEKLHDELQVKLKGLLEEPADVGDTEATVKAKVLYKSCVNISQIEMVGDKPLRDVLLDLGGWPVISKNWDSTKFNLEFVLGKMRGKYNAPILIDSWIGADDKNSSANIIQVDQPALGMPSRDYYLNKHDTQHLGAYLQFMLNIAKLMGAAEDMAKRELSDVIEFEKKLANVTQPQSERHDTGALYKKLRIRDLYARVPGFDWLKYFRSFIFEPLTMDEQIVSFAGGYFNKMVDIIKITSKRTIANYILWRVLFGLAPELTGEYQEIRKEYRRVMQGITKEKIRWKKCVEYVNERMGMAVGALFIRDNFNKESKVTAMEMIKDIQESFSELLEVENWMDNETKVFAREKAMAMRDRIGYPEFITDRAKLDKRYAPLNFEESEYFENILKVEQYDVNKTMKGLRTPVKKDTWDQDPAVVNAFYNPNTNDIVFPAGILQPPFYSKNFPKSLNYGGIGVVIGHEITHGFDDKGRQYDKNGNLLLWWKNETIEAFRERAKCMVDQYGSYKLEQIGMNIDGKNTQGENIADNGGLKQAYRAYNKWITKHGEEPLLPGLNLSHNQLFFLNYAQIWCGKMRDEEALHKLRTSVHSPGPIRVMVPLSNSKEFSKVYECPLGSPMNPEHKCSVW